MNWKVALSLFLLCWVAFGNSLRNEFMIDDRGLLLEPATMHQLSYLPLIMRDGDAADVKSMGHFRPVTRVFRSMLYYFCRQNSVAYRVVNILLFYGFCLLAYRFFTRFLSSGAAFAAAALLAVHPINNMPVNYITAHEVMLFGSWALLSLEFLDRYWLVRRWQALVLSLVFFVLAFLTQEIMLMFPLYAVLYLGYRHRASFKDMLPLGLLYLVIVGAYVFFRMSVASMQTNLLDRIQIHELGWLTYLGTLVSLATWYLSKLILPQGIVLIYGMEPVISNAGWLSLALVGIVGLVVLLVIKYWRDARGFLMLWLLAGLLPLSGLCFIYPAMGMIIEPHWFFVGALGFFGLVGLGWEWLLHRRSPKRAIVCLTIVLASLALVTQGYNRIWKNEKTYCSYWLTVNPQNHGPNFWLAYAYLNEKNYAAAKFYFERALVNDFMDWEVYVNLGLIERDARNLPAASEYFKKAAGLNPKSAVIVNNLGTIYELLGEELPARDAFIEAARRDPYLLEPRLNLAAHFQRQENWREARRYYEQGVALDPDDARSWLGLLEISSSNGERDQVAIMAEKIERVSRDPAQLTHAGSLVARQGNAAKAATLFEKALTLDPKYAPTYLEFGKLLGNLNRFPEAIALWEKGKLIPPPDPQFDALIAEARRLLANTLGKR